MSDCDHYELDQVEFVHDTGLCPLCLQAENATLRAQLHNIGAESEQYHNLHVAALAAYRELDGQGYASIYDLEDALGNLPLPTNAVHPLRGTTEGSPE